MSNQTIRANDKTVLLTGGTGAFGRFLAFELLRHNIHLILLVRGESNAAARARVQDIIDVGEDRIEVFRSDLTEKHLGMSEAEYADIVSRATHILHAAASIRFALPLEQARLYNVKTTERMINFAKKCSRLVRFGFVSTAMVAGKRSGVVMEDEFEHTEGFKNTYEQTKYEAEALMRTQAQSLPVVIFRPPLIITPPQQEGSKSPTNFLRLTVSFVARGYLPFIPGKEKSTVDVVDGKEAADIICKLLLKDILKHTTYHITNGVSAPTVKKIHELIEKELGEKVPLEYCGNIESFNRRAKKIPWYKPNLRAAYRRAKVFLPEAAFPKIFDNRNTCSELDISKIGTAPVEILRLMINKNLWRSSM